MTTTTHPPGRGAMIDVEGISRSFGETRALAGVDMSVPAGTVQGLLGPNGAGKTTLVRILATLLAPDTGRARVSGVDVQKDPNTVRSLIGLAGQYAAVDETLTGRENLVMVGRLYRLGAKLAKVRAAESLERLGLVEAADRPVKTYSGGMRRRLDLGASLVGRPRVLILDEPTTGLDPRTRLDMWSFIRDLVAGGTTVLLTTQYLEEADQLADHSIVIDRGQVIASGTSAELKARLGSDLIEIEVRGAELDRATAALAGIGCGAPHRPGPRTDHHPGLRPGPGPDDGPAHPGHRRDHPSGPGTAAALPRRRVPLAHRAQHRRRRPRRPACDHTPRPPACTERRMTAVPAGPALPPAQAEELAAVEPVRLPRSAIFADAVVIARRNLTGIARTPQLLVFATIQPVMFVLLFRYVFGGAIHVPGISYVDFLIPGIIVQTVVFGGTSTAVGLSQDMSKGIIDRFRSLPMSRSAVLAGRTIADLARNVFVVLLMIVVGFAVGFRFHNGFGPAVAAVLVALLLGYTLSWVFAFVGLTVADPESAQLAGFLFIFPLVFASSVFVSIQSMPGWLQAVAKVQPITRAANAVRALTEGGPISANLIWTVVWSIAILAVFAPLAVRRYRKV